jgi:HlyD family secretion protein
MVKCSTMTKKSRNSLLLLLAIVVAGIFAYFYYQKTNHKKAVVQLASAPVKIGYIARYITATGTIEPVDTVSVGAQVSGVVESVYADYNSKVKKGQLLARVDASLFQAQADQARANLMNMQSNLVYQDNNFSRQSKLFNLGAISKADYQLAQNQYQSAKAAVDYAAAQVKLAERNLFYTNIYSPITGIVLNRNVSAGQTIASSFNAPTLFVIAKDLTKMQVRAAVDEADIGEVRVGEQVRFGVDAFPNDTFQGIVQQILLHAAVTANVVTYTTLINVDNTALKLKPGMTATANIYIEEDSNAVLIPATALRFKPDSTALQSYILLQWRASATRDSLEEKNAAHVNQAIVWIKNGDSLIEKRILAGMTDGTSVKVIRGLNPGEEVVTGIRTGAANNNSSATNRSPFLPQMRPRSGSSPAATKKNSSQ